MHFPSSLVCGKLKEEQVCKDLGVGKIKPLQLKLKSNSVFHLYSIHD